MRSETFSTTVPKFVESYRQAGMSEFLNNVVSFPAVIFTVTSLFFLGFWVLTTLLGSGFDSLGELDLDVDVDVDVDVDGGGDLDADADSAGFLRSAMEFLGISGMPLLLALNLLSIFAWATSMIAMTVLGDLDGAGGAIAGVAIAAGSVWIASVLTGRIGGRLEPVFIPTRALRRGDLVGSICTVTTMKVTETFGQAEVRTSEGDSLVVQVRCDDENELTAGSRTVIFDVDQESEVFRVSADMERT